MGGTYAILPAYEADIYGPKHVGPTHGVMMAYSALAALVGPNLLLKLRKLSEQRAFDDLLTKVSPDTFHSAFHTSIDHANDMFANKTLTIAKLLTVCPEGTLDPTPYLWVYSLFLLSLLFLIIINFIINLLNRYNTTMYSLSGLMVVASLAHASVTPYIPKQLPSSNQESNLNKI